MNDETNVTFSGKEASEISVAELSQLVKMFDGGEPIVHHISHNCSNTALLETFGSVDIGDTKDGYFGLPISKKSWIPLGELWLQSKEGKVIQKFSIR